MRVVVRVSAHSCRFRTTSIADPRYRGKETSRVSLTDPIVELARTRPSVAGREGPILFVAPLLKNQVAAITALAAAFCNKPAMVVRRNVAFRIGGSPLAKPESVHAETI